MPRPEIYPVTARDVTTYYVWDAFVRASHWLNVLALAVLVPRGFTSATRPFAPAGAECPVACHGHCHQPALVAAVVFTMNGWPGPTGSPRAGPTGSGSASTSGGGTSGERRGGS